MHCGYRSQTQLGSCVAVAVVQAGSRSSDSTLAWEPPYAVGAALKNSYTIIINGLRIWCCPKLQCRLQRRLGSGIAVAVAWAGNCSSYLTPSLGISMCCGLKKVETVLQLPVTPQPQQLGIQATSATYITAHGKTGSLTH